MLLETERLILREFVEADWRAMFAYQSDPLYLRFNPWDQGSEEKAREFVAMFMRNQTEEPRIKFQLAIVLPGQEDTVIGNCGIRLQHAGDREAEMGYELAPWHWGKGYATEAAGAMLSFGFEELNLHRVSAHCIAENTGSARVLEKLGMKQEGRLREKEWMKGRWWDTLLYAVLRDERG
ncbi:MAG TPA: GNAT family protein [Chloroflexia bacterium]|nr:GNAT family protein [Chloroflexia bacterium]